MIIIKQRQKHIDRIYKIRLGLLIGSGNVRGLKESAWTLIGLGEVDMRWRFIGQRPPCRLHGKRMSDQGHPQSVCLFQNVFLVNHF